MQKQLEKPAASTNESKSKSKSSDDDGGADYRNVPPPHKFSDSTYDEQRKQISEDINEAVQVAAELIQAKKKQSSTAVSTNDEEAAPSKKRRHSDDLLEDGELKNKKTKSTKGADKAFFLGIDLGDVSSDDDEDDAEEEEEAQGKDATKKKIAKKA